MAQLYKMQSPPLHWPAAEPPSHTGLLQSPPTHTHTHTGLLFSQIHRYTQLATEEPLGLPDIGATSVPTTPPMTLPPHPHPLGDDYRDCFVSLGQGRRRHWILTPSCVILTATPDRKGPLRDLGQNTQQESQGLGHHKAQRSAPDLCAPPPLLPPRGPFCVPVLVPGPL